MARYIDADIAHEMLLRGYVINDVPTSDVQEVRHGKWVYKGHLGTMCHAFKCSICKRLMFTNSPNNVVEEYPYCHCGAKMDGKD